MTTPPTVTVNIESVRTHQVRDRLGDLADLGASIQSEGLRHPITLWSDGTLVSGARRLRAHFLISGTPEGSRFRRIPAVFVDTIEDAAVRLLIDNADEHHALPLKASEVCAIWAMLSDLDAPAAIKRIEAKRRQGVALRRETLAGKRKPGRTDYSSNYVLGVLAPPFGMSEATASRLWAIYMLAISPVTQLDRREAAAKALQAIDNGESSIWANYKHLLSGRPAAAPLNRPKVAAPVEAAPAARQVAAWNRALPQLEGIVDGLTGLGWPHPDLTWEQIGPVHARMMKIRRDMEKMIRKMKETNKS